MCRGRVPYMYMVTVGMLMSNSSILYYETTAKHKRFWTGISLPD